MSQRLRKPPTVLTITRAIVTMMVSQASLNKPRVGQLKITLACRNAPQSQGQGHNTLATSVNAIVVKKGKKVKIHPSQINYFHYQKKDYYANMCPIKEPKIEYQSWQPLRC